MSQNNDYDYCGNQLWKISSMDSKVHIVSDDVLPHLNICIWTCSVPEEESKKNILKILQAQNRITELPRSTHLKKGNFKIYWEY